MEQLKKITGTLIFGSISLGALFALFWATTTFIDAQVDKRVLELTKNIDNTSAEVKELRQLNIAIAELILQQKKTGGK